MAPPNKESRRTPAVERGSGEATDDPERGTGTVAGTQNPLVSRGGQTEGTDPERRAKTVAKAPMPAPSARRKPASRAGPVVERGSGDVESDPERYSKTNARAAAPPERERKSRLKKAADGAAEEDWEAPPGKMSREQPGLDEPAGDYETGSSYGEDGGDAEAEEKSDYHTGNDYEPLSDDQENSGSMNLEGDGLDALDPELDRAPSRTQALEQLDEGDDGGEGEDDDANATHAGPPLKLEIVGGPDSGKSKKFKAVRLVIGRTPGVDLQLSDQSVSRRHVELVQGDGGVLLRDLGSGNGTKVNGQKVAEKVLEHGDEIGIGKTRIRFVDEVSAFKKAREAAEKKEAEEKAAAEAAAAGGEAAVSGDASAEGAAGAGEGAEGAEEAGDGEGAPAGGPSSTRERVRTSRSQRGKEPKGLVGKFKALEPKKRLMLLGGAAAVVLLLVVFAVTRPKPPPPEDPNKKEAAEKMQLARDAVRAERYEEAVTFIEQAEKLVPGIDAHKLLTNARSELAVVNALAEVREAIEQKRFEDAKTLLAKVPQGSVKTEDQKKKVTDDLAAAQLVYQRQKFEELLIAGELDGAAQVLAELPDGPRRELSARLDEAKAKLEEIKKEEERQSRMGAAASANYKKQKKAEAMVLAFAVVQRKFAGQEWARAAAECDRVVDANPGDEDLRRRAKMLQSAIPNYGRDYEDGVKKFRAGQIIPAVRPLRKAWEYYQQIDFQTPMGEELKEKLAQASVSAGKEALLRNDLGTAAINFRDAVKLDPSEPKGRQGLDEVIGRCDEVYQQAYMIRDREPHEAVKLLKIVVEVTPSGSTIHEKAKNLLAAMSP